MKKLLKKIVERIKIKLGYICRHCGGKMTTDYHDKSVCGRCGERYGT